MEGQVNLKWLEEKDACSEGKEWWIKKGSKEDVFKVISDLKKEKQYQLTSQKNELKIAE